MDSIRKLLFSLIALVLVGAAAYYILKQDRVFDIIIPSGALGDKVRAVVNPARERIVNITDSVVGVVKGKVQGVIDEITGVVKQKAFDSLKQSVNDKLNEVGQEFGVPKPSAQSSAPPSGGALVLGSVTAKPGESEVPLGFSAKAGQPEIFVLKDGSGAKTSVSYAITWGDGKSETGTLAKNDTKPLSHTWAAAGEYNVEITMTIGETIQTYRVYIIVYP